MAQWLRSLIDSGGAKGPRFNSWWSPPPKKKMFPSLLAPLQAAGAVDDKDLAVSSDQTVCTPTLGIMGEQCCTLNGLPNFDDLPVLRLNEK